jgi:hypothetical protein
MKTLAEFEQFVKDEGLEIEEDGVPFMSERTAADFADKARSQGFNVAIIATLAGGVETWIVAYTGAMDVDVQ